jgi:hypothetical protein
MKNGYDQQVHKEISKRGLIHFNEIWEREQAQNIMMDLEGIPDEVWSQIDIEEEKNPHFLQGFTPRDRRWDVRSFRHRLVVDGHLDPRSLEKQEWTPGDHLLVQRPDRILETLRKEHYYHPIILSERPIKYRRLEEIRRVLGIAPDEYAQRPSLIIGRNPLGDFYVSGTMRSRNHQGPSVLPWAVMILCTDGNLPAKQRLWVAGDKFKSAAKKAVRAKVREARKRGVRGWVPDVKVTVPDKVWELLDKRRAVQDLVRPTPRKTFSGASGE